MSRSVKKNPICGTTTVRSEKVDKIAAHRRERHAVRDRLRVEPLTEVLPARREMSDVWTYSKDGKVFLANARLQDLRK
jgi:hypothetical protein